MSSSRRRRVGAEIVAEGVHFRVAAPGHQRVAVVIGRDEHPLDDEGGGHFSATVTGVSAGALYRFRIDDAQRPVPDPASRFQPEGVHGPSQVIDSSYAWRARDWRGAALEGAVLYEMHIGTFTREGTYRSAVQRLGDLADLGITIVELMPVNEFAGRFGWGYDGVDLWAPTHLYGTPDDLRLFIDSAHALGLAVILDVVYNHLGPDGCYLQEFTRDYFTNKYENEWGASINFDGRNSAIVREFFSENAAYWIDEFRFDGLRIDATQSIFDESRPHILREIADSARAAAGERSIVLIAENEPQHVSVLRDDGLDALWNDDWHHASRVALTGRCEAYYSDYAGTPQEFVSMAKLGFLYQGQRSVWQKKRRGSATFGVGPAHFVIYMENHDQVANSAFGQRLHELTSPGRLRAMTALLLLSPQTPMLFQGQELGLSSPFHYFADHKPELAESVKKGRRKFLDQFPSIALIDSALAQPEDPATFEASKLDHESASLQFVELHRDLLRLRREDPIIRAQRTDTLYGAVIGSEAFVLRWVTETADDRLLLVNLGQQFRLDPAPEPLLAHPEGRAWKIVWSSESPKYGGAGTARPESEEGVWSIPAHAALLLR